MNSLDILIIGIICYSGYKLYKMLGVEIFIENEKTAIPTILSEKRVEKEEVKKEDVLDLYQSEIKEVFQKVINAFITHDKKTLKEYTNEKVFQSFEKVIDENVKKAEKQIIEVISEIETKIHQYHRLSKKHKIELDLKSDQVHFTKNIKGDIVEGDDNQVISLTDTWVLEKEDKKAANWVLVEVK